MQNPLGDNFGEEWLRLDFGALGAYFSRNTIRKSKSRLRVSVAMTAWLRFARRAIIVTLGKFGRI
jgi:hypothetical protein